jgi:predicted RNA-binding protein YlqC (UPF0109 family)
MEEDYDEDITNFERLQYLVEDMVYGIAWPNPVSVEVVDVPRKEIRVTIQLDAKKLGHVLGRGHCNIRAMMQVIRAQQFYPHDRYIRIEFLNQVGKSEVVFINTDVSKLRTQYADSYKFDLHQLRVEENGKFISIEQYQRRA